MFLPFPLPEDIPLATEWGEYPAGRPRRPGRLLHPWRVSQLVALFSGRKTRQGAAMPMLHANPKARILGILGSGGNLFFLDCDFHDSGAQVPCQEPASANRARAHNFFSFLIPSPADWLRDFCLFSVVRMLLELQARLEGWFIPNGRFPSHRRAIHSASDALVARGRPEASENLSQTCFFLQVVWGTRWRHDTSAAPFRSTTRKKYLSGRSIRDLSILD